TVLITGGGGCFGFWLCSEPEEIPHDLFDISSPAQTIPEGITFVSDIGHLADVEKPFMGMSLVCSMGMSGREQLNRKLMHEVNVGHGQCPPGLQRRGVPRLVYTSTFNVIFRGQVITNGDESLPYLPLHPHPDHYSRTKSIAEKKVLEANGPALERGKSVLRTCALRPAIYGPGEQRHLPRIVSYMERGLFKFVYGDPRSLVEFVHVDNLVQAHILASEALRADKGHVASGQPYFISDGRPVNNFEFFRPLVEGLGYTFPSTRLPLGLIYCFAFLTEMVHFILGRLYNFQPFLTRTEVYKTGVTHYFSLEKARKELGYEAQPYDLQEVVEWFEAHGHGRSPDSRVSECCVWGGLLGFLLVVAALTWLPPPVILLL
uniref:3-beta hydroxysteroid dehydrogenase/isomerase domain-containing protein n=1 Tax=Otolemur garnettii TaxID=30611 RepID=H0XXV2_OTOGA